MQAFDRMAFVGILPAAGQGSRLESFRYAKETLPVAFVRKNGAEGLQPVLAMEHSLLALREAGIDRAFVLTAPAKQEICRLFGSGLDRGVRLAYVFQDEPRGLAHAIADLVFWAGDVCIALALPDTVFRPLGALSILKKRLIEENSDLVLGVFPTQEPQRLSPVELNDKGRVLRVFEKPEVPPVSNTWGLAVWSPRFTRLLGSFLKSGHAGNRPSISHAFDYAVRENLRVSAVPFPDGVYVDIGTPKGLKSLVVDLSETP